MPKITIQQFRSLLAADRGGSPAVRAYREVTRRPGLVPGVRGDWGTWTGSVAPDPAGPALLGDWGTWAGNARESSPRPFRGDWGAWADRRGVPAR